MTEADLDNWRQHLDAGSLRVVTNTGQIEMRLGTLVQRPPIYAAPHSADNAWAPRSFSDQLAMAECHCCIDKLKLLEAIFPPGAWSDEAVTEAMRRILRKLSGATAVSFTDRDAGRLGNFEVIRYIKGDYTTTDGLCCTLDAKDGPHPPAIHVWIEPPLAADGDTFVRCRLFNGVHPRTLVLDELRRIRPGEIERFVANEPFSESEIAIWKDGQLVAFEQGVRIRQYSTNLSISGRDLRVQTPWSQGLPAKLQQRAERVSRPTVVSLVSKDYAGDPWVPAEEEARRLVRAWFPATTEGRFFEESQETHVTALEFLTELLTRPNVQRAVLADPYFDEIPVGRLLIRLGTVPKLRIVTSQSPQANGDPLGKLIAACEKFQAVLPSDLTIVNLEPSNSPTAANQQFHDRFLLIELANGLAPKREVWMLGTSLSAMGMRYPLIITPLPEVLALSVWDYVEKLDAGKWRPGVVARQLWPKPAPVSSSGNVCSTTRTSFPGSDRVLWMLVPDVVEAARREEVAIARGLLAAPNDTSSIWHLSESLRSTSATAALHALGAASLGEESAHLGALSHWAYRGGPDAKDYAFTAAYRVKLGLALQEHLADQEQHSQTRASFDPLTEDWLLPESLDAVWTLANRGAPADAAVGLTPEIHFFAEALWCVAPEYLVALLDETGSFALVCWLIAFGRGAADQRRTWLLLQSRQGTVQALGVVFLADRARQDADTNGADWVALAVDELSAGFPQPELTMSALFLCARRTVPGVCGPANPFAAATAHWPTPGLAPAELERAVAVIDGAAPSRVVPLAGAVASYCPDTGNAAWLDSWCVEQLLQRLPMKGLPISEKRFDVLDDDSATTLTFARAAWRHHGRQTPSWFAKEVIAKLNRSTILEPLSRARDYNRWSDGIDGLLCAYLLGVALVEHSATADRQTTLETIFPAVSKSLRSLGLEPWHYYGNFHDRLGRVAAFLAFSADSVSGPTRAAIEELVSDEKIPGLWRLRMLLSSRDLALAFRDSIIEMASAPTVPANARNTDHIARWAGTLTDAVSRLADRHSECVELAGNVSCAIERWRKARA